MKKNVENVSDKKLVITSFVVAISIVLIGVSFTYAYFTLYFKGSATTNTNSAANMNVTSTLESVNAIDETQMNLINEIEVPTSAKKVEFTVTNEKDSNVDAKYIVKLVNMSITKNLSSKYFKWRLVVNQGTENEKTIDGNFFDETIGTEGNNSLEKVTGLTKELMPESEAIRLNMNTTNSLIFYIWLENEEDFDQLYLTNGSFNAKLSIEAFPTKEE